MDICAIFMLCKPLVPSYVRSPRYGKCTYHPSLHETLLLLYCAFQLFLSQELAIWKEQRDDAKMRKGNARPVAHGEGSSGGSGGGSGAGAAASAPSVAGAEATGGQPEVGKGAGRGGGGRWRGRVTWGRKGEGRRGAGGEGVLIYFLPLLFTR